MRKVIDMHAIDVGFQSWCLHRQHVAHRCHLAAMLSVCVHISFPDFQQRSEHSYTQHRMRKCQMPSAPFRC